MGFPFPWSKHKDEIQHFPTGQEFVCVFNENSDMVRMLPVYLRTETELRTSDQIFPIADAQSRFLPEGGVIHFFGCITEYLQETQHLAELEESIVLRNFMNFQQPRNHNIPLYAALAALVVIVLILN